MRNALLIIGIVCIVAGAQLLIVDKIVLHDFSGRSSSSNEDGDGEQNAGPIVIDLPDSGGYVLVAVGTACILYFVGSRHQKERR